MYLNYFATKDMQKIRLRSGRNRPYFKGRKKKICSLFFYLIIYKFENFLKYMKLNSV